MQNTTSLKLYSNGHKKTVRAAISGRTKVTRPYFEISKDIYKPPEEKNKLPLKRTSSSIEAYCPILALGDEEHENVNTYLSTIKDPLWKCICEDIVEMMGPASALKIWKSKLGQLSSRDKILNITCENEEIAAFIQQYDFVILGSLQKYFPALKQLKVNAILSLSH